MTDDTAAMADVDTPDSDQSGGPSPLGARVGPVVVGGALLVTVALLGWLALAPVGIAGPLSEAPFTVPARLVLPPDEAGCLTVVDGRGASTQQCLDELAASDDASYRWTDASFDDGDVVVTVEEDEQWVVLRIDPDTGEVQEREVRSFGDGRVPVVDREPPPDPRDSMDSYVTTDGDRVVRMDMRQFDPRDGEVLLDLDAPIGWTLRTADVSVDGRWVVALTPDDRVIVAPTDGSTPPYVWVEADRDRWVELRRAIEWESTQ